MKMYNLLILGKSFTLFGYAKKYEVCYVFVELKSDIPE